MGRSNINLVGNTTQGQNVGVGEGVFKDKILGNTLRFKELSVTGTTMIITSDDDNIYFSAATGGGGVSIGYSCKDNNTTSVGCDALPYSTNAFQNNAFGVCALALNDTGVKNIAIGYGALQNNNDGDGNIAIGDATLFDNVTGCANVAIGCGALTNNCGCYNTAIGYSTMGSNSSGYINSAYGYAALGKNTSGTYNTAIGVQALCSNLTGARNVALGRRAGCAETGSDKLFIANCGICTLISGDFAAKTVTIDNKLITTDFQMTSGAAAGCFLCSDASGNGVWTTGGGGSSYWDREGTTVSTLNAGDNVRIDEDSSLIWTGASTNACIWKSGTGLFSKYQTACTNLSASQFNLSSVFQIGISCGGCNLTMTTQGNICTSTSSQWVSFKAGSSSSVTAAGGMTVAGGNNNSNGFGGALYLCSGCGTSGIGGNIYMLAGCGGGTTNGGDICICAVEGGRINLGDNLPACTSETSIIYISSAGHISTGTTGGGGLDAFAALTSNSSVAWDTSGGLNKTWSINGSYTLTLNNVASGMYGTVRVTVTAGTPTITLAGGGLSFRGNGSLASLANGVYMLAWVATSATTVEWNIATYA